MNFNRVCLVCLNKNFHAIYNHTLLTCDTCGFVTANMDIDENILQQTYTENYFKGEEYVDYLRDKEIIQANFRKRLKKIFRLINQRDINNVIEIGCAYGFFAEELTKTLPGIDYVGFDVVPEAIEYGKNILRQNLQCRDYLTSTNSKPLSDVFMFDVIEHLPQPELFISKTASELMQGGRIYITTGDIDRLVPRIQKQKWRMIHPPSHLHYFSKKTISKLLEAKGFEIISITYPSVSRSLRLIFFSLFMLNKNYPKWVEKTYNLIPAKLNVAINTFDIMFVIARKK